MSAQEQHKGIEDILVEYSNYLDNNVANTEMDDIHIGVDLLNQAEELGYTLGITRDKFTEDKQCIPGFVYAINSKEGFIYVTYGH